MHETMTAEEIAAYHEAAHAVLAVLFNRGLDEVVIDPRGGGECRSVGKSARVLGAAATMAGPLVNEALGSPTACLGDHTAFAQWLTEDVEPTSRGPVQQIVLHFTREILAANWREVEAVADALRVRKRLSGYEVQKIMGRVKLKHPKRDLCDFGPMMEKPQVRVEGMDGSA